MTKDKVFYYCLVTCIEDHLDELLELEEEMAVRGVDLWYKNLCRMSSGGIVGRIFRVRHGDRYLLPKDEQGTYFGDDKSGYRLYRCDEHVWLIDPWGNNPFIQASDVA